MGDPDSDTRVDVDPRCGDDAPVLVLIPFLQRGHGDGEEALLLIIRNEDSATGSVLRRFHHDAAQFVLLASAPVLGVVPVGGSVAAGDGERSSQRCCNFLWSGQTSGVRAHWKPEHTQDWTCKRQRFPGRVVTQVSLMSLFLPRAAVTTEEV